MADYSQTATAGQSSAESGCCDLRIPSFLPGFIYNGKTTQHVSESKHKVYWFEGKLEMHEEELVCPECGCRMHRNQRHYVHIRHIPIGRAFSDICVEHYQLRCPRCNSTKSQNIQFKVPGHRITDALYNEVRDLLAWGLTNKTVAELTGLGKNTVKEIDKERLQELYTIMTKDGLKLRKPEKQARFLGIDEFKLHDGHKYATHIIDLETGHVLWIQPGKKKQVVYDFIEFVGNDWMKGVKAVSCDMNSDFQEAFEEKCPHLEIVFDYFHVVKNFNDKVISEVRKDLQKQFRDDGDFERAKSLARCKYILTSKKETLKKKDEQAADGRVLRKKGIIFTIEEVTCKGGKEDRYNALIKENELLFTADLVKEKIRHAYEAGTVDQMKAELKEIVEICEATENKHFQWFSKLINRHFNGMAAHAKFRLSNAKIEGINNKIKTLRRQGYGYPDDEYFFLKIIDASRREYVRNEASHRKSD